MGCLAATIDREPSGRGFEALARSGKTAARVRVEERSPQQARLHGRDQQQMSAGRDRNQSSARNQLRIVLSLGSVPYKSFSAPMNNVGTMTRSFLRRRCHVYAISDAGHRSAQKWGTHILMAPRLFLFLSAGRRSSERLETSAGVFPVDASQRGSLSLLAASNSAWNIS